MNWTRQNLIDWVRSRIDEMNPGGQSPETIGEGMIEKELDESATQILRTAQKQLVYPAGATYRPDVLITKNSAGEPHSIIIPLSGSFLRFLRVKADFWNKPVDGLVSTDDKYYRRQFNPDQKASVNMPVAAIIPFNWSRQAESGLNILDILNHATSNGVTTFSLSGVHSYVPGSVVAISGLTPASLNGNYPVIYAPSSSSINVAITGISSHLSGTVRPYTSEGAVTYNQALEIFPAPADFIAAMANYQLAVGINAELADSLNMVLVSNSDFAVGKKPIIYDCLIAEKMAAEALPDSLADPVVWLTAGRCLTSLRAADLAKAAYENYSASLSRLLIGFGGENPTPQQK